MALEIWRKWRKSGIEPFGRYGQPESGFRLLISDLWHVLTPPKIANTYISRLYITPPLPIPLLLLQIFPLFNSSCSLYKYKNKRGGRREGQSKGILLKIHIAKH
jgi:hypothetical protein